MLPDRYVGVLMVLKLPVYQPTNIIISYVFWLSNTDECEWKTIARVANTDNEARTEHRDAQCNLLYICNMPTCMPGRWSTEYHHHPIPLQYRMRNAREIYESKMYAVCVLCNVMGKHQGGIVSSVGTMRFSILCRWPNTQHTHTAAPWQPASNHF